MKEDLLKTAAVYVLMVFIILTYPVVDYTEHKHKEQPHLHQSRGLMILINGSS